MKNRAALISKIQSLLNQAFTEGESEARRKIFASLGASNTVGAGAPSKRDKSTKGTVKCPVVVCQRPGIRPLHCFCQLHYDSIPAEKREILRAKQLESRKLDKEKKVANG